MGRGGGRSSGKSPGKHTFGNLFKKKSSSGPNSIEKNSIVSRPSGQSINDKSSTISESLAPPNPGFHSFSQPFWYWPSSYPHYHPSSYSQYHTNQSSIGTDHNISPTNSSDHDQSEAHDSHSSKIINNTFSNHSNTSFLTNMHMTDQQRLEEARALTWTLDKLSRSPKRISPSAPTIIPITMLVVTLFALICLVVKLFMNYLNSKSKRSQKFGLGDPCSPDIPTTPEVDQTSLATTASMKTRGSLRHSSRARRNKLPPVSLYQMKQKQSPKPAQKLRSKAAMKAMAKASKSDPNRSSSRDSTRQEDDNSDSNINNDGSDSPTNLSQRSFDTDEIQPANQSSVVYAAAPSGVNHDEVDGPHQSTSYQPEVHIVQIRDLEDNVQHSHYPQTESEI